MKNTEVINELAKEFGTKDLAELNKILKAKVGEKIKFKLMGPSLGYLGLTVVIKMVTPEGIKIFDTNRVRLVRFSELISFVKAKPKVPRPKYDKPKPVKVKPKQTFTASKLKVDMDDDDDDEDEDDDDFEIEEVIPKRRRRPKSNFIPIKKK